LLRYVDEARSAGAEVTNLGGFEPDRVSRRFPPLVIRGAKGDLAVMREEIFGPLLPVIGYETLDEAISWSTRDPGRCPLRL